MLPFFLPPVQSKPVISSTSRKLAIREIILHFPRKYGIITFAYKEKEDALC